MVLAEDSTNISNSAAAESLLQIPTKVNVPSVNKCEDPPSYDDSERHQDGETQPMMIIINPDFHPKAQEAANSYDDVVPLPSNMITKEQVDPQHMQLMNMKNAAKDNEDLEDHWSLVDIQDTTVPWNDLNGTKKLKRVMLWFLKPVFVLMFLYFFICSLDLMSSAFRLLGGKTAGEALSQNELLSNPVCGLMIGIMVTVLVQSSSTSTSIIVSMVAAELLQVQPAIFIIMGANIGTSVTNTIVSLAQSGDRNEFRRAFGGATVHDMFNWLAVIVLLPIEAVTGYLYHLTNWIVEQFNIQSNEAANVELLKVITKPFTKMIIQIDSKVLNKISTGELQAKETSLLKKWCEKMMMPVELNTTTVNTTDLNTTSSGNEMLFEEVGTKSCPYLFANSNLSETAIGGILLVVSLLLLCACLIGLVRILNSMLRGRVAKIVRKTLNSNLPGKFSCLTGYLAIIVGAVMTFIVQSSSVFTSAMTPLVGMGVIKLERMYPLTLGSNIGTTATGMLAALACSGGKFESSLQIALCHLLFNISGILIWYPIPFLRKLPIKLAKGLGNTTAKYRWFAVLYLIVMFFLLPGFVFALSMAGVVVFLSVGITLITILLLIIVINVMQKKCCRFLPECLKTWEHFPLWTHSLEPVDKLITKLMMCCICRRCIKSNKQSINFQNIDFVAVDMDISNSSNTSSSFTSTISTSQSILTISSV
ncbi:sodium-dependent phosphate transport protein 2A-like [Anneissia japonica]|uniref:sodium-dependent phosphate transport protein 2A-like n=1 Tax=Anneissia japonica TaxID=1529436 RepID=UPI0014257CA2|nr:sodium-dependent phosphate transport protein 2A-like [Anneissia japonica]